MPFDGYNVPTDDIPEMTAEELANVLGEEVPAPEPAAEAPAVEEPVPQWVHEPTGKQFESEVDLLRYESGFKDNKYGTENKELRAKLEAYESMVKEAGAEPATPQMTPEQQSEAVFNAAMKQAGVDLETVDPSAYKTIWKIFEAGIGMYNNGVVEQRFNDLAGKFERITTQAQEAQAYSAAGIKADQIREVLEERPYLKQLAPGDRAAVVADLMRVQEAKKAEGESPNALRQALQSPSATDHVEGSVGTTIPDSEDAVMKKALEMSDKDLLAYLGRETAKGPKPWEPGF